MSHAYRIDFGALPEQSPAPHARMKAAPAGTHRLRVAEFQRGFVEADWCRAPHTGYVLEGRLRLAFPGQELELGPGDGLHIPPGEEHRHKATPLTERVRLVLFEPLAP